MTELLGQTLTGETFNELVKGPFYKVLAEDHQHYDFKYREGLNVDHRRFYPSGRCSPGGLYFTDKDNLASYLHYGTKLGLVQIPSNAQVYIEHKKYKTNKLVLTKIIRLSESKLWEDPVWSAQAVRENICALQYVQNPTYELCLEAVRIEGTALRYVPRKHKTYELCQEAVNININADYYVPITYKMEKLHQRVVKFIPCGSQTKQLLVGLAAAPLVLFVLYCISGNKKSA